MNCFTIEMVPYEIAGLMYDLKSCDLPSLFLQLFQHYSLAIFSMASVSKLWMWVSWFFCPELCHLLVVLCINRCNITCKNIFIILYIFTSLQWRKCCVFSWYFFTVYVYILPPIKIWKMSCTLSKMYRKKFIYCGCESAMKFSLKKMVVFVVISILRVKSLQSTGIYMYGKL